MMENDTFEVKRVTTDKIEYNSEESDILKVCSAVKVNDEKPAEKISLFKQKTAFETRIL